MPTTPLGAFLREVRRLADPYGLTYQFVRLYRPAPDVVPAPTLLAARDDRAPILSIIVAPDTDLPIPLIADALAGQADPRVEVVCAAPLADELGRRGDADGPIAVVVAEQDPGALAEEGIRHLFDAARGEYAMVVHGRLPPAPGVVAAAITAIEAAPGSVVCVGADEPGPDTTIAFPTAMLGGAPCGGSTSDLIAAWFGALAPLCGVTSTPPARTATAPVAGGDGAATPPATDAPVVWTPGTPTLAPSELVAEHDALRRRVAELEQWSASIAADNAALNAALDRPAVRIVRGVARLGRRLPRRRAGS